jgi:hypothetical protein
LDIWKVRDERESVMISFKLRLEDQGELWDIYRVVIPSTYSNPETFALLLFLLSVAGISGYELDDWGVGVRVPLWSSILSPPNFPDRLWGQPNPLSKGYRGLFTRV